ncbi:MAG: ATP-binding protein [Bacteroidetes bacterium]|nr:ATP-binding protein [Bacteroidota bacterium]MBU1114736.1 ATP-binding protein [Bacteroidota bacterium]MBU1796867.1 ATP-binding protein [Bacteroidota bacterium]
MKEIVVISGKGGTGKTSITASFAYLAGNDVLVADCDVDAADLHLLLKPDFAKEEDFYSGLIAEIDQKYCTNCGRCANVCRFDAIPFKNNHFEVDSIDCEGCAYCAKVCPTSAIELKAAYSGKWFTSTTRLNSPMIHARLGIGSDNSGKLVTKVKNEAKILAESISKSYILIDGSPGIGCPVVSSLSGANFVLLITEPSISGIHDLKRVYDLVKSFKIKAGCIINKFDINKNGTDEILEFLKKENIEHIASIPYNENFTKAMTNAQTIVEYDKGELTEILTNSWEKIKRIIA